MAGDWIKMECSTPDKQEVLAIAAKLGWDDPDFVVGKLFRMWRWFDQHTVDGNAKGVTSALLDRIVGVTGFAEAMEAVGWLSVNEDGVSLPSFAKHCGITAKKRAETARRVAKHRDQPAPKDPIGRVALPRPLRRAVIERDGGKCVYCGRREGEYSPPETAQDALLCLDHVVPLTRGGSDDLANLVCACSSCNRFKSDRTPDESGLAWPLNEAGERVGNTIRVTSALPREEKRREEEKPPIPPKGVERFERFWKAYPRKVGKGAAEKAWAKAKPSDEILMAMLAALDRACQTEQWTKDNGRFIPHPSTWLNERRWLDDDAGHGSIKEPWDGAI